MRAALPQHRRDVNTVDICPVSLVSAPLCKAIRVVLLLYYYVVVLELCLRI